MSEMLKWAEDKPEYVFSPTKQFPNEELGELK